jgi:hypothetical protein
MTIFTIQNRYDGYEATEVESVFNSLEAAIEKLKSKHPRGILKQSRRGYKSPALNEWLFSYYEYEDKLYDFFYSIKEFKVNQINLK